MSQRSPGLFRLAGSTVAIAIAAFTIAACGSSNSSSSSSSSSSGGGNSSSGGSQVHVGLAQPTPSNDHSFGEATHDGAVQAEKQLGIKLDEIDSLTTPKDQLTALENLARSNKLVLMQGGISAASISPKFPSTNFVVTDGSLPPRPNNHSVNQNWIPVSYLAGVAAAKVSKTHVVGFVGGIPIPVILTGLKGFTEGAKSVDPKIKVVSATIGSFTDSVKGKSAAAAEIAQGADVIWADLDTAHQGVVEAAKESGKDVHVIGAVAPKCTISSGLDIGDAEFFQTKIVYAIIKQYVQDGKLPPTLNYALNDGVSKFQVCPSAPASVKTAIAKTTAGLMSGQIKPAS